MMFLLAIFKYVYLNLSIFVTFTKNAFDDTFCTEKCLDWLC